MFAYFALDSLPGAETCYKEVFKLLPGNQLHVTPHGIKQSCYWRLQDQRKKLHYRTRDTYYEAFQEVFQNAVQDALRTPYSITAHISGGLDSTSVAAQAAVLLTEKQRPLFGFTAIPNGLDGPSDRTGWVYHEMPVVQTLLNRYPIIQHHAYHASPQTDIFHLLQDYYPLIDQPFRNISNLEWILGCYAEAHKQNGRVILIGSKGNSTISWAAFSSKRWLIHWKQQLSTLMKPHSAHHGIFEYCQPDFLKSRAAKKILRQRTVSFFPHLSLLLSARATLTRTAQYGMALYNGVVSLDPTHDLNVIEFCYNVPDWVHRSGEGVLANRLLVRRGLSHLLPDSITSNTSRGEQASDWFLHYNEHATSWHTKLRSISKQTQDILSYYYNPEKFESYYNQYPLPLTNTNSKMRKILDTSLMRYMSTAFFLDYLILGR